MGAMMAAGAAAPIAGGLLGYFLGQGDRDKANQAAQDAAAQFNGMQAPTLSPIQLQKLQQMGQLSPEMMSAIGLGPSAMQGINIDPRLKSAQMQALQSLQGLGQTGLGPQDVAALAKIRSGTEQGVQANNASILQNAQARGMGGSGAALAAQLMGAQQGAQRSAEQGLDVASMAQQRALQAIAQSGGMAGQMQGQEFGQQAQIANAADQIARFNVQNQQNVQAGNVQNRNAAQAANIAAAQAIANQNASLTNQQTMYNQSQLPQQQYANQMGLAGAKAGSYANLGNYYQGKANQTGQMFGGVGQGVGAAANAYGNYQQGQQNLAAYQDRTNALNPQAPKPQSMNPIGGPQQMDASQNYTWA